MMAVGLECKQTQQMHNETWVCPNLGYRRPPGCNMKTKRKGGSCLQKYAAATMGGSSRKALNEEYIRAISVKNPACATVHHNQRARSVRRNNRPAKNRWDRPYTNMLKRRKT